jgi:2,3-bisphosphoglycerate-dependent phosphoglycerate mutase
MATAGTAAHGLVLLRHGESTANLEGTFAGWEDVPLTANGVDQAVRAGHLLRRDGFAFDVCCTSVLSRAVDTARHTLQAMGAPDLPLIPSWRLNERHYGALQGLNKREAEALHGKEQVALWRRGYAVRPPRGESMHDTAMRVLPFWRDELSGRIRAGQRVLLVIHGTTFRALARLVGGLGEEQAQRIEVPNGVPFVCEFDSDMRLLGAHFRTEAGAQPGGWGALNPRP